MYAATKASEQFTDTCISVVMHNPNLYKKDSNMTIPTGYKYRHVEKIGKHLALHKAVHLAQSELLQSGDLTAPGWHGDSKAHFIEYFGAPVALLVYYEEHSETGYISIGLGWTHSAHRRMGFQKILFDKLVAEYTGNEEFHTISSGYAIGNEASRLMQEARGSVARSVATNFTIPR